MKLFSKKPKPYEPRMHIDKYWPIYRENVFVDKKKSRLPHWTAPLFTLLAIILIVFYLAPTISRRVINLGQKPRCRGPANQSQLHRSGPGRPIAGGRCVCRACHQSQTPGPGSGQ